ncbi:MAG: hypothetical protein HY757_09205 [Nitrospirae bacterium]|nr:hypothetical protein [Nitrospirota bacterium]
MLNRQDNGYVLITVLLMLLVLTVVGLAAIGTSTLENLLSGNIRLRESNLSQADGCVEISTAVIERTVRELDTRGFSNIVNDAGLSTELSSTTFAIEGTPDVICAAAPTTINVDIDKMYTHYISGTGIEFASGYEGLGKSGGSGFYSYYRINSTGSNALNSTATVGTIYRYVPK